MKTDICPCGSQQEYQACCKPLHDMRIVAKSPEQLMRSRYSAFYFKNSAYLIHTLHPDYRQSDDVEQLQQTFDNTQWCGLKIIAAQHDDATGIVEFVAFYHDKPIGQLHEKSRFTRKDQQWFYQDGAQLKPIKLSRNDSCYCGSGKKLKKCHPEALSY